MEKEHYYTVTWKTPSGYSTRSYSRDYQTEREAVAKAKSLSKRDNIDYIRVWEKESWDTPDGVTHTSFLGFVTYWDEY